MTQPVAFHFTSPQFVFESGTVAFTKGGRLFSAFRVGTITDGVVEGVLVEGPIEFDAMLHDLTVVRSEDRRRYQIGFFKVTGDLQPGDLRSGRVLVRLNPRVILIVRVEDSAGHRAPNVPVSVNFPNWEATAEIQTDVRGKSSFLQEWVITRPP